MIRRIRTYESYEDDNYKEPEMVSYTIDLNVDDTVSIDDIEYALQTMINDYLNTTEGYFTVHRE